jgi:ubiquinone/menaquinone biosynthesis C-methylase UbiE
MTKPSRISSVLDNRDYPGIFYRYTIIVRIIYLINFFFTLRNWYVYRALKKTEKEFSGPFSMLDAGCGMGEFAIGSANRNPASQVLGIDFVESNELLAAQVAGAMNLRNIKFIKSDLTLLDKSEVYDLILCNSALQFIKNDGKALANLKNALKPSGKLILYVPVTYRRYFPWTKFIEKKYLSDFYYKYHNDFLMHKYEPAEVLEKLENNGFEIRKLDYAYGIFGALSFELYSLLLAAIKKFPAIISILCIIIYSFTLLPVQLILMLVDYLYDKSSGNGLLILAGKN